MPRVEKSVTILTGMIVAALYVILIVGAAQESCWQSGAGTPRGRVLNNLFDTPLRDMVDRPEPQP